MATMKLFKCHRCKQDDGRFYKDAPVCPRCSLSADDEKMGRLIQRLVLTHFDPPTDVPGIGINVRACEPTKSILADDRAGGIPNPWHAGTGDVTVVNCPACMASEAYRIALAKLDDDDAAPTRAAMARVQELVHA